jgi:ribosomal protein S18 acetylase RimI-like enzyme
MPKTNNSEYITLTPENIADQHICCGIADKKVAAGCQAKKDLMTSRFKQGYRFRKLAVRGKVFIEYVPAEYAWAPIIAPDHTFIHCFWVSGQYKGRGHATELLKHCINESKGKKGIVAIVANKKKPFLSDKSFYIAHGFEVCDTAPPYFELLVKPLKGGGTPPQFADSVRTGTIKSKFDLTFFHSNQCPFTEYWTDEMISVAAQYELSAEKIKIDSQRAAQNAPSPFTIFTAFLNGKFLTHEMMAEGKFGKALENALKTDKSPSK